MKSRPYLERLQAELRNRSANRRNRRPAKAPDVLNNRMGYYLSQQRTAVTARRFARSASPQSPLVIPMLGDYLTQSESIEIARKCAIYLRSIGKFRTCRQVIDGDIYMQIYRGAAERVA
jgi:hypothetical protein